MFTGTGSEIGEVLALITSNNPSNPGLLPCLK